VNTAGLKVGSLVTLYLSHMQADDDLVLYGSVPTNLASAPIPAKPIPAKSVGEPGGLPPNRIRAAAADARHRAVAQRHHLRRARLLTNRSDQEEVVCTTVQTGDLSRGFILLQATYHASLTTGAGDTVLARATVTPPPDAGTCVGAPLGGAGTTPATDGTIIIGPNDTISPTADALFVINAKRFGDLYGASAETATINKIEQLFTDTQSPVDGQILLVDSAVNGVDVDPGAGTLAYGKRAERALRPGHGQRDYEEDQRDD